MTAAGRFLEAALEASYSSNAANETVAHAAHAITAILCDRETAVYGIEGETHNVHVHANFQFVLLGLGLMLIGGGCIQFCFQRIPLPYTVLVFFFGCMLGVWVLLDPHFTLQPGMKAGEHSWGGQPLMCNVTEFVPNDLFFNGYHLGNSWRLLAEMDPHLFLNVLLPPLLFESAFAIDWHIFAKLCGSALFLALPGLIVATTLTGLLYAWFYAWPWESCILLGCILSATDPVAVVALLREMGAKKSLATLIEAESLLNDGTAVVVFSIFVKAVEHGGLQEWLDAEGQQPAYLLWVTARMSVVGPLMGVAFGVVTILFLEQNWGAVGKNDANVETICTLAMPFLVFYLAETAFGESWQMSGVLAVVAYGLVFASPWGRVRIDPEFWPMIGHLTNTLIFSIAGVLVVLKVAEEEFNLKNLGYGVAIYVLLTLIRGIVMLAVIPCFRRSQYGFDWRDALVCTWGGLRGAVGLALAVAVSLDDSIVDCAEPEALQAEYCIPQGDELKQIAITHVCFVVATTLILNASTCGALLRKLGMTKLGREKEAMLDLCGEELRNMQAEMSKVISQHPIHSDVNWEGVHRLVSFNRMIARIAERPPPQHSPQDCWLPGPHFASDLSETSINSTSAGNALTDPSSPTRAAYGHSGHGQNGHGLSGHGQHAYGHSGHGQNAYGASGHGNTSYGGSGHANSANGGSNTLVSKKLCSESDCKYTEPTCAGRCAVQMSFAKRAHGDYQHALSPLVARNKVWPIPEEVASEAAPVLHPAVQREAVPVAHAEDVECCSETLLREAQCRLLTRVKAHVQELFEKALIRKWTSSRLEQLLQTQFDKLEYGHETLSETLFPFDPFLKHLVARPFVEKAAIWLDASVDRCSGLRALSGLPARILVREFARGYDLAVAYLRVHEEVQEEHAHGKRFSLSDKVDELMKAVVAANIEQVSRVFAILRMDYPVLCTCINTVETARMILNHGHHLVHEIKNHGELADTEADRLLQLIHDQSTRLLMIDAIDAMPASCNGSLSKQARKQRLFFISTNESHKHSSTTISSMAATLRKPITYTARKLESRRNQSSSSSRRPSGSVSSPHRRARGAKSVRAVAPLPRVPLGEGPALVGAPSVAALDPSSKGDEAQLERRPSDHVWIGLSREISVLKHSHQAPSIEMLELSVAKASPETSRIKLDIERRDDAVEGPETTPVEPYVRRMHTT